LSFSKSKMVRWLASTYWSLDLTNCTLFVDVWGTFYRQILSPGWLRNMVSCCGCHFAEVVVCINNVANAEECDDLLLKRYRDDEVNCCIRVGLEAEHGDIKHGLHRNDFKEAPFQSLADLCAIQHCKTEYMVFVAGDAFPWGTSNWVREGIEILKEYQGIMAVAPMWNGFKSYIEQAAPEEYDSFYTNRIFSDQMYLIRTADFKADIYHETNKTADAMYPSKYGNSFEKRVGAYMLNHGKFRAILKNACYLTRP
jgi:hypothetical protein